MSNTTDGLRLDIVEALKAAPGTWLYEGCDRLLHSTNPCLVENEPLHAAFALEDAGLIKRLWPESPRALAWGLP